MTTHTLYISPFRSMFTVCVIWILNTHVFPCTMYSAKVEEMRREREEERKECERLALKNKDVRRKVQKYDRCVGNSKTKVGTNHMNPQSVSQGGRGGGRGLKGIMRHSARQAEQAAKTAARLELLLNEEPG